MEEDHDPRNEQNISKQKSKNLESFQQAVLIYLLSRAGVTVEIKKQKKSAEKTYQIQPVQSIIYNGNVIQFADRINAQASKMLEEDKSEQRLRRYERNKIALAFNELVEIAVKFGYEFGEKNTRKAQKTVRMKKIIMVKKDNKPIIEQKDIEPIGMAVNNYIVSHFNEGVCLCNENLVNYVKTTINSQRINMTTSPLSGTIVKEQSIHMNNTLLTIPKTQQEQLLIIPDSIKSSVPSNNKIINSLSVPILNETPIIPTPTLTNNSSGNPNQIEYNDIEEGEIIDINNPINSPSEEQIQQSDAMSEQPVIEDQQKVLLVPQGLFVQPTLVSPMGIQKESITNSDFPLPQTQQPIKKEEPQFVFNSIQKTDMAMSQDIGNELGMSLDFAENESGQENLNTIESHDNQSMTFNFSTGDEDMRTSRDAVDTFFTPNNGFGKFGKGTFYH
ncbi:hypothetical protein ENUP19_0097G0017 [Entamoeba nuttalli]|uniref:Uncharacterized protein n=2 Tax=Entamoeba nuttalli TaxID=412467 RepID=K2HQ79_ENTNP|nr:hypothetical protein ENU1_177520 [Entamoeba nuttalli P19]EKE38065.1 hypothetical protein ENU1_177520 [Entamoeba nuttalli P19]|eukprot:XP_008859597.1 hypothetical protein ENU1_177520 [Entamoeba nuttalli P19]